MMGRVGKSHLLPAILSVLDSIGKETFIADCTHVDQ
jgi:hypothetical protein